MKNKEELKELLKKVRYDEKLVEKYIDTFNEFFEVEQKHESNVNVLESIFTNFISLAYKVTNTHLFLSDQLCNAENELKATFTDEQQKLFEVYDYIQTEYSSDYALKAFIYAFCLGREIEKEGNNFIFNNINVQEQLNKLMQGKD